MFFSCWFVYGLRKFLLGKEILILLSDNFSFSFMPLNFLKISVYVECSGVLSVIIYAYFLHEPL